MCPKVPLNLKYLPVKFDYKNIRLHAGLYAIASPCIFKLKAKFIASCSQHQRYEQVLGVQAYLVKSLCPLS